ncbi:MAG: RNA polymerase factor sigma-54 [Bacteroidetes bacterium]|nr:RNA polymerase factor sigma-54 [Bacteroidota bacterium]MCL1969242.1 RNA polymerase factor sigma-54 [Bacteroidota bacterium]
MQKHSLTQQQQLKQTAAQTVQLMHLVELSTTTLEQEILKEVEENPALEIDRDPDIQEEENLEPERNTLEDIDEFYDEGEYDSYDDYRLQNSNISKDEDYYFPVTSYSNSFQDDLLRQLHEYELLEKDTLIAEYIIGCLDETGYLLVDTQNIAMDFLLTYNMQITNTEVENVLKTVIQQFEPVGVGARNIQECLTLQLKQKTVTPSVEVAKKILTEHFDFFSKKQYDKLQAALHINNETLKDAINEILKLQPYPVFYSGVLDNRATQITPDFIITIEDEKLVLNLNNSHIPKLKINQEFKNQFELHYPHLSKEKKLEAELFIKDNIAQAKSFIGTLNLRELVLFNTMYAIMDKQRAYFLSGDDKDLKPMILKDIAQVANLDVSTVSRVSNSKYVQTPFGTIPLKHLFSESIGNEYISSKEVKSIIMELVENENKAKPLTDDILYNVLKERGYEIARRTIAKYREQLHIPVARLRKEI